MTKPISALELHYPMIQFLINDIECIFHLLILLILFDPLTYVHALQYIWYNIILLTVGFPFFKTYIVSTAVTSRAKTYANGFPLNGWSRWAPVGYPLKTFTKALEVLRKPLGFFLYPLKALRKAVEQNCSTALQVLEKAARFFPSGTR